MAGQQAVLKVSKDELSIQLTDLRENALDMPPPSPEKHLKVCSLFSGCGGLDLGFTGGFSFLGSEFPKTGFDIIYSNDFDVDAKMTYTSNKYFEGHRFDDRDVREVTDFENIPDFDLLIAGFPCQPFSSAGNREGVLDKKGRGVLFEETERFIKNKKPIAFVFENVRGILTSRMPDGTSVPHEIIRRLSEVKCADGETIKFNISQPSLLNASDYGVPQQRYRVLIVGIRQGYTPFSFDRMHKYVRKAALSKRTLKAAIDGVENLPQQDEFWDLSPQQIHMVKYIKRSWKDVPYDQLPPRFKRIRDNLKLYRAPNFYRRFDWDEIAGTITASAQPENCGILHPKIEFMRRFTIREIARIQSFPDDFIFKARNIQGKYKIIGNAVPPILGFTLACAVKESILRPIFKSE